MTIKSFRHKGLKGLFETGRSGKIAADLRAKCLRQLDALNAATKPENMDVPGWRLHRYKGRSPALWSVDVNGPWRITFEWEDGATRVNLEQPH